MKKKDFRNKFPFFNGFTHTLKCENKLLLLLKRKKEFAVCKMKYFYS